MLVENLPDRRIMEGIFADELKGKQIRVDDCLLASAALAMAKGSLLERPGLAIALVVNANTTDPIAIEERRGSIHRILGQVAADGWHATLVVPRLDVWAEADQRIHAAFSGHPERLGPDNYVDRAVELSELVRQEPFDRQSLRSQSSDFRALENFIQQHAAITIS